MSRLPIKSRWAAFLFILVALAVYKFYFTTVEVVKKESPPLPKKVEMAPPKNVIQPSQTEYKKPKIVVEQQAQNEVSVIAEELPFEESEDEELAANNYILCEYIVSGESRYQFTGEIRLINKGTDSIYGWSVQWEYEDGSTLIEATDVALSGSNPYTGEYLDWNAEIAPGETVKFSFTGMKAGERGPKGIKVTGDFCM